jgi:hypothetical protein
MLISNLYREVLADALAGDARALEIHANSVEAKYVAHIRTWLKPSLAPSCAARRVSR